MLEAAKPRRRLEGAQGVKRRHQSSVVHGEFQSREFS
jgi:hypothetical protein